MRTSNPKQSGVVPQPNTSERKETTCAHDCAICLVGRPPFFYFDSHVLDRSRAASTWELQIRYATTESQSKVQHPTSSVSLSLSPSAERSDRFGSSKPKSVDVKQFEPKRINLEAGLSTKHCLDISPLWPSQSTLGWAVLDISALLRSSAG